MRPDRKMRLRATVLSGVQLLAAMSLGVRPRRRCCAALAQKRQLRLRCTDCLKKHTNNVPRSHSYIFHLVSPTARLTAAHVFVDEFASLAAGPAFNRAMSKYKSLQTNANALKAASCIRLRSRAMGAKARFCCRAIIRAKPDEDSLFRRASATREDDIDLLVLSEREYL